MQLSESASQVLNVLIGGEMLARPELSRRLAVTAPTVGTALRELTDRGLTVQTGSQKGALGRTAALYGISPRAGWVLGLDFGSTQIVLVARGIGGGTLDSYQETVTRPAASPDGPSEELLAIAAAHIADFVRRFEASNGSLLAIGVALPHVIPNQLDEETFVSWDGSPIRVGGFLSSIGVPSGVPVFLENNTNCAALAELAEGSAKDADDFVFLQVGVRTGVGLVIGGQLRRGAVGAGGEIALLPFPLTPTADPSAPIQTELEAFLGSDSLLRRVQEGWDDPRVPVPGTVKELFALSESGHRSSREWTSRHSADVAKLALLIAALLDPALIVLGGGVGQNRLLVSAVRAHTGAVRPELQIAASSLPERGTAVGASVVASEHARSELVGQRYVSVLTAGRTPVIL